MHTRGGDRTFSYMRFNNNKLNSLPRDRYNIEFKILSKTDILNQIDPFISVDSNELTPFELENILNEDLLNSEPGLIKFKE